jgi:hypothetical protein
MWRVVRTSRDSRAPPEALHAVPPERRRTHPRSTEARGLRTRRVDLSGLPGASGSQPHRWHVDLDCLLLDEAQILGSAAWSSILPTMSARENPQAWLLGTPPTPQDDGEVFARLRQRGIEGKDARLAYLEWSAEEDDDLDDKATWAKANPAFGTRIQVDAIEAERSAMTDDQFAMERLGMWTALRSQASSRLSRGPSARTSVARGRPVRLGVECGPDLAWASVAFAGQRADGEWHFELDDDQHTRGRGVAWLVPHLESLVAKNSQIRASWSTSPARSRRCSRSGTAAGTSRARRSR